MTRSIQRAESTKLKQIVAEASRALAHVDADRLEEMTLYCESLLDEPITDIANYRETAQEMAIFSRVLDATRANVRVMRQIRELREADAEHSHELCGCVPASEAEYGHD